MQKVVSTRVVNKVVLVVSITRPAQKNAVNGATANALFEAFSRFDKDPTLKIAVLEGSDHTFCAGADLASMDNPMISIDSKEREDELRNNALIAPMGCTRMALSKPVICAVEGFCVAGGLELACWCDLRVAATNSVFGVFCRRWGVPLIDGGTVRLPRLIGQSRALDMILTGRSVSAQEAFDWGLVNRLCDPGRAIDAAIALAMEIAEHPQVTMKADRRSVFFSFGHEVCDALRFEFDGGFQTLAQASEGAQAFTNRKKKSKL